MNGEVQEQEIEGPPTVEEFLERHHRLFTVIGVFGALAVYLTDFTSNMDEISRLGVGAVLLLFALSSFIVLKKSYSYLSKARRNNLYSLVVSYAIVMYSILSLLVSILWVMSKEYPKGSGSVIAASILYASLFVYFSIVFQSKLFTEFQGQTELELIIRRIPYLGLLLLTIWQLWLWKNNVAPQLIHDSIPSTLGSILGSSRFCFRSPGSTP